MKYKYRYLPSLTGRGLNGSCVKNLNLNFNEILDDTNVGQRNYFWVIESVQEHSGVIYVNYRIHVQFGKTCDNTYFEKEYTRQCHFDMIIEEKDGLFFGPYLLSEQSIEQEVKEKVTQKAEREYAQIRDDINEQMEVRTYRDKINRCIGQFIEHYGKEKINPVTFKPEAIITIENLENIIPSKQKYEQITQQGIGYIKYLEPWKIEYYLQILREENVADYDRYEQYVENMIKERNYYLSQPNGSTSAGMPINRIDSDCGRYEQYLESYGLPIKRIDADYPDTNFYCYQTWKYNQDKIDSIYKEQSFVKYKTSLDSRLEKLNK